MSGWEVLEQRLRAPTDEHYPLWVGNGRSALKERLDGMEHRLAEAERLLREIILEQGGVSLHNSTALHDALAFLGHDSYHALSEAPR